MHKVWWLQFSIKRTDGHDHIQHGKTQQRTYCFPYLAVHALRMKTLKSAVATVSTITEQNYIPCTKLKNCAKNKSIQKKKCAVLGLMRVIFPFALNNVAAMDNLCITNRLPCIHWCPFGASVNIVGDGPVIIKRPSSEQFQERLD